MRRWLLAVSLALLALPASAQQSGVMGTWLTASGVAQVRIAACPDASGGALCGFIVGLINPKGSDGQVVAPEVATDYRNENPALRSRKVMGMPLLEGRFFDDHDRMRSEPVIVVDDVLAKSAFPGQDALGKNLWIPDMPCVQATQTFVECSTPYKIVGVVGHVRYWGLAGDDQAQVRAQLYYPFAQVAPPFLTRWSQLMSIAVRTSVPPLTVVWPLRLTAFTSAPFETR